MKFTHKETNGETDTNNRTYSSLVGRSVGAPPKKLFLCPDGRVATREGRLVQRGRTKFVGDDDVAKCISELH